MVSVYKFKYQLVLVHLHECVCYSMLERKIQSIFDESVIAKTTVPA